MPFNELNKLLRLVSEYDDDALFGDNLLTDNMTDQEIRIAAVQLARATTWGMEQATKKAMEEPRDE